MSNKYYQRKTNRPYKANRKSLSNFDSAWQSYNREVAKLEKMTGKTYERLTKKGFSNRIYHEQGIAENAAKAEFLEEARRSASLTADAITTEQARNLKKLLVEDVDEDAINFMGLSLNKIKNISVQEYRVLAKTDTRFLSLYYEYLTKSKNMKGEAARAQISADVFGSE